MARPPEIAQFRTRNSPAAAARGRDHSRIIGSRDVVVDDRAEPQLHLYWGIRMSSYRTTLFLLPSAAILGAATMLQPVAVEEVEASQCLSSAAAVRQEYPGAWPSWTLRAPGHKGARCWFPATREARGRRIDSARDHAIAEARPRESARNRKPDNGLPASADETDLLGLSVRTRMAQIPISLLEDTAATTFNERFEAAFARSSLRQSSIIRRMVDPGRNPQ
jgi:hypothetical protein